jgi:hypothetical protein
VSKELKMLLVSILLMFIGGFLLWLGQRDCEMIEYQDLDGSHFIQVCKGQGE